MAAERLVAACLITRDEADRLPACLAAVRGLTEEVVVHDTGSVDGTVAVARRLGAAVVEGRWEDDFAAARNVALDRCTAAWIVHVDADEVLAGDLTALRRMLEQAPAEIDGYIVAIDNLLDDGTGSSYASHACRIFRRERAEWRGALHEQVVARAGRPPLRLIHAPETVRITHHGYLQAAMARGGKLERNARLARSAVETAGAGAGADALLDLGRALKAIGQIEEAARHLLAAADRAGGGAIGREALGFASSCLLGLGRLDEAEAVAARLRSWSTDPAIADFIAGQVALQRGDAASALARFDGIGQLVSEDGREWPAGVLSLHRALAHALAGQWAEAAGCYADAIDRGAAQGNIGAFVEAAARAGQAPATIAAALAGCETSVLLAELLQLPPGVAQAVALRLWSQHGPSAPLLEAIGRLSGRIEIEEALEWTIVLREGGVVDPCPLLAWAAVPDQPIGLRVYAAAAATALGDERARAVFTELAPLVPHELEGLVLEQLEGMGCGLTEAFQASRSRRVRSNPDLRHIP